MKLSLQWKWMMAIFTAGALVLLLMAFYLGSRLTGYFEASFENRWRRELRLAGQQLAATQIDSLTLADADHWSDTTGEILGMRVTLVDLDGFVQGDSEISLADLPEIENHGNRPEIRQAIATGFGKSRRFSTTIDRDLYYLAIPFGQPPDYSGVLRIAVQASEIEDSLSQIRQLVWVAGGMGFTLLLIIGFTMSRSFAAQLLQMVAAAKQMARRDFSTKINVTTNDELAVLGTALNQMGEDLQHHVWEITRERDQLQTILNSMVEGVMVTDSEGMILLTNNAFEKIMSIQKDVIGKSAIDVVRSPELQEARESAIRQRQDSFVAMEVTQSVRRQLEAYVAVLGSKREPVGVVTVFHDVTRVAHLEKVRRDFVANVSHELRTPLTAIKGYVETLLDGENIERAKVRDFLGTVLRHSDRMSKLVEDLLHLSRLESVEQNEGLQNIDLCRTVEGVADSFAKANGHKGSQVELDLPHTLSPVMAVANDIESALENLVDNATKYGAEGGPITIRVREFDSEIQVSVIDRGDGIPTEEQGRIFERFYRVDKARSRSLGGTGLGLSIVKHTIQSHNGRVWVTSQVGVGSTFTFALPKAAVPAAGQN